MNRQSEKITAIYVRSCNNNQPWQLLAQAETLIRTAQEQSFEHIRIYLDDGFSGLTCDRPSFRTLLHDIIYGKVDKLLVTSIDRLHRNALASCYLIGQFLPRYHVEILSMSGEEGLPNLLPFLVGIRTLNGGVE